MSKKLVFRQLLKRSLILDKEDVEVYDKIPDAIFDSIFEKNFNSNINTAERVLFNRYGDVQKIETEKLEREKLKIKNLSVATKKLVEALKTDRPVLFLTDTDNDGSLSQSILIEFLKLLPEDKKHLIKIEYAQAVGRNHGFTYEMVEKATDYLGWSKEDSFLIITADNGINNRDEQERIQKGWKNSDLVITDHHLPDENLVIQENERTVIFNPKYNPTAYFQEKNISGANTLGVYLTESFKQYSSLKPSEYPEEWKASIQNMRELGYWANYLDYAQADLADMPVKSYVMDKAAELCPLMNTSNSMANFVTGEFSEELLDKIEKITDSAVEKEWVKNYISEIKSINLFAQKLLSLYTDKQSRPTSFYGDFYTYLADEVAKTDLDSIVYKSMNPNYIQQLRPIIYNLAAIDQKDAFDAQLADTMVDLYKTLRRKERELLDKIRNVDLLVKDSLEFSSIFTPVDKDVTKLFNRKLLGKAYNEANNGFNLVLGSLKSNIATGSMRTVYPISEILNGKEKFEKENNVKLYFKGHELAAGFFIESTDKDKIIDKALLEKVNAWINERVAYVKDNHIDTTPTVEIDFGSVSLVNRINAAVKANLAGMKGVPAIISFSPDVNHEVWVTDSKTTAQINLKKVVESKKYGYLPIATDLKGGAFIAPMEMLRAIVDSEFKPALRLSYLADGVFIGSQLVEKDKIENLFDLKSSTDTKEALTQYYKETYKDSHFIDLDRDYFKNMPYFKYNKYGEKEFLNFENLIITLLEKSSRDVFAVVDTEGTGLGKAPRCFNIGSTNIVIDPKSGDKINKDAFNKGFFKTSTGYNVLMTQEQIDSLIPMRNSDDTADYDLKSMTVLYKSSTEDGISGDRFVYPGKYKELNIISNFKVIDNEENPENSVVVANRKIKGFASAYLIREDDFAITKEFEKLTGISQGMLNELGSSAKEVDEAVTNYYASLKNEKGSAAKIIFQAHNMPYDKGVISANFNNLNEFMNTQVISDSAKMARLDKLAYDDTPVCSFKDLPGLSKLYFYDSPFSDYSMTTFLLRTQEGKGGVFPDTTAKVLLRYNEKTQSFSIIDREKKDEYMIPATFEELYGLASDDQGVRVIGEMPNNAVKYSVERLSSRAMIRNIILNEDLKIQRLALEPEEQPFANLLNYFQDNYHFDDTMSSNLKNFFHSMGSEDSAIEELFDSVDMDDFAVRFLLLNKKIQAKFHDGWIYEKVLNQYEPKSTEKVITKDIVEQINYYTDLPDTKIREVLSDVIRFKRDYKIEHAIVHEQHNNIVQDSKDGMGLSDTAYEIILPQLLGLMKHYNPYLHSVDVAADQMIHKNIKGAMIQSLLQNINSDRMAKDSFSMRQTLSFDRDDKTSLVMKSKSMAEGSFFENAADSEEPLVEEVKLKLKTNSLPPYSALYAKASQHIEQEDIYDLSSKLDFIVINEQVKYAIHASKKINPDELENIQRILEANDAKAEIYRDEVLSKFDSIDFEKREDEFKKVADILVDWVEQGAVSMSSRMKIDTNMLDTADILVKELTKVLMHINPETEEAEMLEKAMKDMREQYEAQLKKAAEKAEKAAKKAVRGKEDDVVVEVESLPELTDGKVRYYESVLRENFLPKLEVTRQIPFKYLLNQGMEYCLPYLKNVLETHEQKLALKETLKGFKITVKAQNQI